MMDEEFMQAYFHGIVLDCADGVRRRVFPRFFTYSADYPEKYGPPDISSVDQCSWSCLYRVLISTIRDMGGCPCPRCLIPKHLIPGLGTESDVKWRTESTRKDDAPRREKVEAARELIYNRGYVVNSSRVDELLKAESYVPTEVCSSSTIILRGLNSDVRPCQNAFSHRLSKDGFDFFTLLVVDLMHEFELGVWKNLLTHLIRILHSQGAQSVHEFNERFLFVVPLGGWL